MSQVCFADLLEDGLVGTRGSPGGGGGGGGCGVVSRGREQEEGALFAEAPAIALIMALIYILFNIVY